MIQNKPSDGQFWRYALPSMFSQLLNSFFIIVDGFFVGQNLGDAGLAAINLAWPIVAVVQAASLAIGTGGAVRLAMAQGKGDGQEALRVRGNTLVLLAGAALVLSVGLYFLFPVLLPLIGAKGELYPLAADYCRVVCLLAACQVLATGLLPLLRGAGRAVTAMCIMILGLLGNAFLDWLFIHVFQWGLAGAAFATSLSQGLCALAALPALLCHKAMPMHRAQLRPSRRLLGGILHYGISPFGLSMSTSVILLLTNLRALRYGGTRGVAVYAVLSYVLGSAIPLVSGVGDGIQPLLSYARGARDWAALARLRCKGLALVLGVAAVCSLGCFCLRAQLPLLFGASAQAVEEGAGAMWTLVLAYPFMALVRFCCSYFCAVGQPKAGSLLAYGEPLAAQPLFLFTLPLLWGLEGVWAAYPAAVLLMAAFALWLLRRQVNDQQMEPPAGV